MAKPTRKHASPARRLAAIMFTDIVGYTALMGSDEDKAFEILRKNRKIHTKLITEFNGILIKEMGDGMLAQFDSAADSVRCAIAIQKQASNELEAKVRIGIHLGDITVENNDVFGDGVNIASRLQSIADPGGIYISETLQKSIRAKSDILTKYLGEVNLKNVDYQVRTYAVQAKGLPIPTPAKIKSLKKKTLKGRIFGSAISYIIFIILLLAIGWVIQSRLFKDKPTVLVLSLENNTGIDTIPHIISGIHTALIGEIGKISKLNIISPYTSKTYKNSGKSMEEMARETKADFIAQPALSCIGDNVCLNFIMTKIGSKEKQVLSEDFYQEKKHIFQMYNQITKEIARKISLVLSPEEEKLLTEARDVDPEAHDLYMKGIFYNDQMSEEALKKAYHYFKLANDIDPNWAAPYQGMASVYERQYQMGFIDRSVMMPKLNAYIDRALELDPNSSWIYNLRGSKAGWFDWEWDKAQLDFLKSIELNPNHAGNHAFYSGLLSILRKPDEAMYHAKKAEELDPSNPFILGICARQYIVAGECQSALDLLNKANSIEEKHYFTYPQLIEASICIGDTQTAFEVMKDLNFEMWQKYKLTKHLEEVFRDKGWSDFLEELIITSEEVWSKKEEVLIGINMGSLYVKVGKYDKAMDYFEKAYEIHSPNLAHISRKPIYIKMKDNPRYIELMKKMNLPLH